MAPFEQHLLAYATAGGKGNSQSVMEVNTHGSKLFGPPTNC